MIAIQINQSELCLFLKIEILTEAHINKLKSYATPCAYFPKAALFCKKLSVMLRFLLASLLLFCTCALRAQHDHDRHHSEEGRVIHFPNVPGYQVLVCDFHQHTVFSDGSVWPNIRVQEALRDSVDAISLTEHLEYQPHKEDIPHPDRNRSFEIASKAAKNTKLIVVNGSEITREMPPGHTNAIFLKDANKLLLEDPIAVFQEAKNQGAFIFWNHPNWTAQRPDGMATLTDMHRKLIADGMLHGIEVVNDVTFSDEAFQIALDNKLTLMGTSDIHGLVDWQYEVHDGGHRPVTLVMATERSADAIKAALFDRRTVVYQNNTLAGRPEQLLPLLNACIQVEKAEYQEKSAVLKVTLRNLSDCDMLLQNESGFTLHNEAGIVSVHGKETAEVLIKTKERLKSVELPFKVLNAYTAPGRTAILTLKVEIAQ